MTNTEPLRIAADVATALIAHSGHRLEVVEYGQGLDDLTKGSVVLECATCAAAILDTEEPVAWVITAFCRECDCYGNVREATRLCDDCAHAEARAEERDRQRFEAAHGPAVLG